MADVAYLLRAFVHMFVIGHEWRGFIRGFSIRNTNE